MLTIGFDATEAGIAGGEQRGVYQYILQLLRNLRRLAPEHQYRLLFGLGRSRHDPAIRQFLDSLGCDSFRTVRTGIPVRWMRRLEIPADLWLGRLNVFHALAHLALSCWRCPVVVTIHDLAYRRSRERSVTPRGLDVAARREWDLRRRFFAEIEALTDHTVRSASRIIAVSRATAEDLQRSLGAPAEKIRTIPLGVREGMTRVSDERLLAATRARHHLEGAYGLYVGGLDPNKNLDTLLEGFAEFRRRGGRARLAMAGKWSWYAGLLSERVMGLDLVDAVRFLGHVPDPELPALYSAAEWVVMPSALEGFGLPALEGMACGAPVIAANGGALPEVVGGAGVLVDPDSASAFAEAMAGLEQDAVLRRRLAEAGRARAAEYRWERTAQMTLSVYLEAAAEGRRAGRRLSQRP